MCTCYVIKKIMNDNASMINDDDDATNPLVQSFLLDYPKHRGNLNFEERRRIEDLGFKIPRFDDYLESAVARLSDEMLTDFKTRFTFCEQGVHPNERSVFAMNLDMWGKNDYFTKRSCCTKTFIGVVSEDNTTIRSSPSGTDSCVLAKMVSSVRTHHYYNASAVFSGVIGEVISQIPKELLEKNNDASYYIVRKSGITFSHLDDMHTITLTIYKKSNDSTVV